MSSNTTSVIWSLISEPKAVAVLVAGVVTIYVVDFYRRRRSYPPGPVPLPIIGNILNLRGPRPLFEKVIDWSRIYGDPFTLWLGSRPIVVASTTESFRDIAGPHRNHLGGRMQSNLGDLQRRGFEDILFSDFNPAWDVLRKVTHVAIRKYAKSEAMSDLVAKQVDLEISRMPFKIVNTEEHSTGKLRPEDGENADEVSWPFIDYAENIVLNVLAVSTFGDGFQNGDTDYEAMRKNRCLIETEGTNGLPSDLHPLLGLVFFSKEKKLRRTLLDMLELIDRRFAGAADSYVPGVSARHFTDALLNAREKFIADDRSTAGYLTDGNIRQAVMDIFVAGIDTSRAVLGYSLLHLANDPELQEDLRSEVNEVLGDGRICRSEDRESLRRLDSFIQEVIRLYPPAPFGLPRKALVDVTVNGRFIPKDTAFFTNVFAVNRDPSIWGSDADQFNARRFLMANSEQLQQGTNSFGIGSRSCPGEKMAQADILYILARTLQRLRLRFAEGPGSADLSYCDSDIVLMIRRNQDIRFSLVA